MATSTNETGGRETEQRSDVDVARLGTDRESLAAESGSFSAANAPNGTVDGAGSTVSRDGFEPAYMHSAVTPERVADGIRRIVGDEIQFGPVRLGPANLASASGIGRLGSVQAERVSGEPGRLRVDVPVRLWITVRVGVRLAKIDAHLNVRLALWARLCDPLALEIHITEPSSRDVTVVRLETSGTPRRLLEAVVNIDEELHQQVRRFVANTLSKPSTQPYTRIDLDALINEAWQQKVVVLARSKRGNPRVHNPLRWSA
jgi:hypothetical protein